MSALLLGVAWTALSASTAGSPGAPSATPPTAAVPTPTTGAPFVVVEEPTEPGPSTTAPPVLEEPVAATRAALTAWGEFAVSGDLGSIRPLFDVAGPQFAQLESEASSMQTSERAVPGYLVTLNDPQVQTAGEVATVTGTVVWSHAAEAEQRYAWSIELHRGGDGQWRLFNVRTVD